MDDRSWYHAPVDLETHSTSQSRAQRSIEEDHLNLLSPSRMRGSSDGLLDLCQCVSVGNVVSSG